MMIVPTLMTPASTAIYASDLAIYKGSTKGRTSLLLMLDTSGSMGISSLVLPKDNKYGSAGDVESSLCGRTGAVETGDSTKIKQWAYNAIDRRTGSSTNGRAAFKKSVRINGQTIDYYLRGCGDATIDASGKLIETRTGKFDRLSRLKDALIQLLVGPDVSDTVYMGLGNFSSRTTLTIGNTTNKLVDGHSGKILVPTAALNAVHREKLIRQLASIQSVDTTTDQDGRLNNDLRLSSEAYPDIFRASSGTPTAHAYAEAAAYMMGTTTGQDLSPVTRTSLLYDGYSVMQNNDDDSKQVYYICVSPGTERPPALGSTVIACDNPWNVEDSTWWDKSNKRMGSTIRIFKPQLGGWVQVSAEDLKKEKDVGDMNTLWDTHEKLPVGWRYGGWMKVANEPMDIEPIGGKVWGNKGARNLVSYRSSPFSIKSGDITSTTTVQGFQDCPSGFQVDSGWTVLCYKTINESRNSTKADKDNDCPTPIVGNEPLITRNFNGVGTYEDHANKNYTKLTNNKCTQTRHYVARPWGDVTQTTTTVGPIDNMYGGFAYSDPTTKNGSKYIAGGTTSSCDGNGIYFLTDGAPNSTKKEMAKTILNKTLNDDSRFAFSGSFDKTNVLTSPPLSSGLFEGETGGWEFIGEYAKKLLDRTKNPAGMQIKTAVVGFGSSFEGLTKNTDGTYDCNSITNLDIKNACLWGQKNAGYGEGGFYQANSSGEIADSILKFVQDLDVNFSSTSLGTISIPLDPLDQTKAMNTGFFPMIQPSVENNKRTWLGNLKKYYIFNGTLTDSPTGGNKVYNTVNNQQIINSLAKDIWFNQDANNSLIDVGGALNKIPVPANFTVANNPINNIESVRKVFVVSDKSLKQVTKSNLATDIADNDQIGTLDQFPVKQRIALLNYLGYSKNLPSNLPTILTRNEINSLPIPQSPYRYLGGVVHSTPLVVTKEATIDATNKVTGREEYVVYGSMDGGLHVVNAASGKEASVFVPDETLSNQPETLVNSDASGALAYGVDAPWAADNTFKVEASGSATKYIARTMNIYGGLRMGGNALYGLDISTPASPSLKFKNTPETEGFSRLGQIWSKPVITNIRVKGEVKKVLIFGGGYDETVFEDGANKVKNVTNVTKGNALYIADASNGTLLWSVSSSNTGTPNNQQKQDDVKFSVVGQPTVRDYNADGLTDVIYFADLGGQIFRIDLNNAAQATNTAVDNLAVRTQTLAKLATNSFTPRFYERLSTAVFKEGQNRFVLVSGSSGNRSYPLEKESDMNNVYGIIDYDATAKNLEKASFSPLATVIVPNDLVATGRLGKDQTSANTPADITNLKNRTKRGWAFALKTSNTNTNNGYVKAMEETQLINSDLYVSLYDPTAVLGGGNVNVCGGGIQGVSTIHRVCMPYGNCAAYATTDNQGIIGIPLGPVNSDNSRKTRIVSPTAITAEKCVGEGCGVKDSLGNNKPFIYKQSRVIKPIRWYEW